MLLRSRAFWPVHALIDTTSRCNLRCSFCVVGHRFESEAEHRRQELTEEELRHVIDQIPRFTVTSFTGGEPFIRPDFMDLVEYTSRRHRCHIITNATLIDEDGAGRLANLGARHVLGTGLVFIGVSLQGTRDTHDRVTGRVGSFDKAVNSIRMIQQNKAALGRRFPRFHITTVINETTVEHLPAIVETAAELGIDICNFPLEDRKFDDRAAHGIEAADFDRTPHPPPAIPEPLLREIHAAAEQVARRRHVELRWPRMPFDDVVDYYQNRFDPRGFECHTPWTKVFVSYYGAVHPCNFYEVGNVREQSLCQIWNGERFRAFRRRLIEKRLFATCPGCCELVKRGSCRRPPT